MNPRETNKSPRPAIRWASFPSASARPAEGAALPGELAGHDRPAIRRPSEVAPRKLRRSAAIIRQVLAASALAAIVAPVQAIDVDNGGAGDGMSDVWQAHYGIGVGENLADNDGDGYTNEAESHFRTDPNDRRSPGAIIKPDLDDGTRFLDIDTTVGVRLKVQYSLDYTPPWLDCPQTIDGDGSTVRFDVSACAPGAGDRLFVRVAAFGTIDADLDTLDQWEETVVLGSSDTNLDSDADRVTDLDEFLNGLDPASNASNDPGGADGLPDDWEIFYFGNLLQTGEDDGDNDLIKNDHEFLAGLNPTVDDLLGGANASFAQYNAAGELTTYDPPAGGPITFSFDAEGNILTVSQ